MSDISRIKLNGTEYTLKDPVARGEETETEGISHLTVDGTVYDCKDIVARGEGEPNAREISKVEVGGKTYQIKDEVARAGEKVYFVVWCEDDCSCTFYGDTQKPEVGSQYKGKTVTEVGDFENTSMTTAPDFNANYYDKIKTVHADPSASGARPKSFYGWFDGCSAIEECDLGNFNTSSVTTMQSMFNGCSSLTTLDVSNFDTSSVTNMSYMFCGCSSVAAIYSDDDKFVTTAVTSGSRMFTGCSKLVGGNGTVYDDNKRDYDMAHIDKPDNPGYFTDVADKPD